MNRTFNTSEIEPAKVSFLTVNYNQAQVTLDLIRSLESLTYANWEIVVVDNGSNTKELSELIPDSPRIKFLDTGENLGFAGGNNAGLKLCTGEYIFFINNDTEVEPDLLEPILKVFDADDVGIVSPKIRFFDPPLLIQYAGATPMSRISIRNAGIGWQEEDQGQHDHIIETSYIHGAAMVVPRKVLQEVGPMYADYFLYYEEYDWCDRIAKAGYKVIYCGLSTVFHKESVSTGRESPLKTYYLTRNRLLFARRNRGAAQLALIWLYFGLIALPKNLLTHMAKGRMDLARAFFSGFIWNIVHNSRVRS